MPRHTLNFGALLSLCGLLFLTPAPASAEDASSAASARRINADPINDHTADTDNRDTQSSIALIDLGGNRLVAAWSDSASYDEVLGGDNDHLIGYGTSSNDGVSWTDRGTLQDNAVGDFGSPSLAHDTETGNVYLAVTAFKSPGHVALYRSTNNGQTFGPPKNVTPGFPIASNSAFGALLAVDNFAGNGRGNVYACWNRTELVSVDPLVVKREIRFTRSVNDGATFTPNLGVLISGADGNGGRGCTVVVDPNHRVYVFYLRGTNAQGLGGDNKFYMRRSVDRGVTFQDEVEVADLIVANINGDLGLIDLSETFSGFNTNAYPRAAVNPAAGRGYLYFVYNDDTVFGNNLDNGNILLTFSKNGGQTWSTPVRINDDTVSDQFHPSIAFAAGGEKLIVSYYSRSHDPSRRMFHRRARLGTLKADGTVAFNQSFQLGADTPFMTGGEHVDPNVNIGYLSWIGEYEQAAGGDNRLSVTWTENRLASGNHPRQPDVRYAQIALPAPASNVGLTIAAAPAAIQLGKNTTLTMTVSATGGQARDVVLSFKSVVGLRQGALTPPAGGSCTTIEGFVTCFLGTINTGGSKNVQVAFAGIYEAGTRTFKATVTSSGRDTNTVNNAASKQIVVKDDNIVVVNVVNEEEDLIFLEDDPISIPLTVTGVGKTVQVIVDVIIEHPQMADVEVLLEAPNGKIVELASGNGSNSVGGYGGGDDCSGSKTVFNDLAATSIDDAETSFEGSFKPETPLVNTFLQPAAGDWILHVTDTDIFNDNIGLVECVRLHITRAP